MKVGISVFLWTDIIRYDEHKPLLELIKSMGFDGVEIPIFNMDDKDIDKISKACDAMGLERAATGAFFDPSLYDPISPDASLRKAAIEVLDKWSEKTKRLGADMIVGPLFQGLKRFSGGPPTNEEWKWGLETLHEGCLRAGKNGVHVGLEPLNRFEIYFANTFAVAKQFVIELGLPNVGILADTMHANIEEFDVTEAFCNAMPHVSYVHISESNRSTPGSGHGIPNDLIPRLKESGYDGWLTIEAFHGASAPALVPALCLWRSWEDTPNEMARKGLEYIRSKL